MRFLLDTHLLLWASGHPKRLSRQARSLIDDPRNDLFFSAASVWEIAIKSGLGRADFRVDAPSLRRNLLNNQYEEIPVTGAHAVAVGSLPATSRDPFDRILIAQAFVEGITLLTADETLSSYPGPIRQVR